MPIPRSLMQQAFLKDAERAKLSREELFERRRRRNTDNPLITAAAGATIGGLSGFVSSGFNPAGAAIGAASGGVAGGKAAIEANQGQRDNALGGLIEAGAGGVETGIKMQQADADFKNQLALQGSNLLSEEEIEKKGILPEEVIALTTPSGQKVLASKPIDMLTKEQELAQIPLETELAEQRVQLAKEETKTSRKKLDLVIQQIKESQTRTQQIIEQNQFDRIYKTVNSAQKTLFEAYEDTGFGVVSQNPKTAAKQTAATNIYNDMMNRLINFGSRKDPQTGEITLTEEAIYAGLQQGIANGYSLERLMLEIKRDPTISPTVEKRVFKRLIREYDDGKKKYKSIGDRISNIFEKLFGPKETVSERIPRG